VLPDTVPSHTPTSPPSPLSSLASIRPADAPPASVTQASGSEVPVSQDDDEPATAPEIFRQAVASLRSTQVRPEVRVETIRAPQRLAPWTYALAAEVLAADGTELATGRLVLLHDPEGVEAWDGVLRLVAFASADLEPDMAGDPLLPAVGWSWLTGALDDRDALFVAAGGTVTQTTSTRFGDLHGPQTTVALELRGSWTAVEPELTPHLLAFADLLCAAAGLPPEGVTFLRTT
jgi:hypothetical protein